MIKRILGEIEDFKSPIILNSGLSFDHYLTLQRIDAYCDNKFISAPNDEGLIFWQLGNQRLPHFVKNIDLDTKDFRAEGQGETNYYQSWIVKLKFAEWARKSGLALSLNDIADNVAKYGSGVWKKYKQKGKTELKRCNLNRLYFDTSSEFINDSPILEVHEMTEDEIYSQWEDMAEKIMLEAEKCDDFNIVKYKIYERHGFVKGKRMHGCYCGISDDKEFIIFEKEQKKDIYFDFHVWNWSGDRWLRVGVVERLFLLQERINTLCNQNAQATEISSLLLLKSSGTSTGNVLKGSESGDVINDADLQQVAIDNRFLNGFITELREIEAKADRLCMTPDVITGDTMPSGTPVRGQVMTGNAAKSAFRFVKEMIGEKMGNIIIEELLPDIVKDWNKGGYIEIGENIEDINIFDEVIIRREQQKAFEEAKKQGYVLSLLELEQIAEKTRKESNRSNRKIDIKDNFFNFDLGLKLNVTGESQDKAQQNDAYTNLLTWLQTNPNFANNYYFRQYAENNGITPIRLSNDEIKQLAETQGPATTIVPKQDKLMAAVNPQ